MEIKVNDLTDSIDERHQTELRELIKITLKMENENYSDVNLILMSDDELRSLNREWRGKDYATDVLSFDLRDEDQLDIEGDIYISIPKATAQAKEAGHSLRRELLNLTVHGALHLCGWTHEDDESLKSMIDRGNKYIVSII